MFQTPKALFGHNEEMKKKKMQTIKYFKKIFLFAVRLFETIKPKLV